MRLACCSCSRVSVQGPNCRLRMAAVHLTLILPCLPAGPPEVLLAYRLSMLCWALFIGLRQLARRGPYAFVFFTGGCCGRLEGASPRLQLLRGKRVASRMRGPPPSP